MPSAVSKLDTLFLSLRGLIVAIVVAFLMLLLPVFYDYPSLQTAAIIVVLVSAIVCVAVFPLVYFKINSTITVFAGRYHLPLAICLLVAPISFVAAFFSYNGLSVTQRALVFGFLLPVCMISLLILFCTACAIARRLVEPAKLNRHNFYSFIAGTASTMVVIAVYITLERLRPQSALYSTIITAAILALLGGVFIYIASSSHIPRFIRLEAPTKRTTAQKYSEFFSPFFSGKKWTSTLSVFVLFIAVFVSIFNMPRGVEFFSIDSGYATFAFITTGTFVIISFLLADKLLTGQNRFYIKLISALLFLNAIVLLSIRHFTSFGIIDSAVFIIAFSLVGVALGTALALIKLNTQEALMQTVGLKQGITSGFFALLITLAIAIGASLAISLGSFFSGIIANAVSLVMLITFIAFSAHETKSDNLTLNIPDYITQTKIAKDIHGESEISVSELNEDKQ